jgi:long-chain acyl-CoA synthetase
MTLMEQSPMAGSGLAKPELSEDELPLQRMYAFEQENSAQLFLTQPQHGQLLNWTWASAMDESRRVAAWLSAQGWSPGSRIVILAKNCAWWIMADFAIWMAGYVSVPFFAAARDASLTALFEHSQPIACFIGQLDHGLPLDEAIFHDLTYVAFPNAVPEHAPPESATWAQIVRDQAPLESHPTRNGTEIATIIYTSGTTGQPKGALRSFRSLAMMGKSIAPTIGNNGMTADRILSYLPLAHIAERAIVEMNALQTPLHIFFTEGQDSFLADLSRAQVTIFFSIPRLYIRFQQGVFEKMPEKKLNRLLAIPILSHIVRKKILRGLGLDKARLLASGAAAIPLEIVQWYRKLGANLVEGYGMTETGITHVTLPDKVRIGYVGNASPYADTRISTDGEVQIKGPMNMAGYFRRPELTNEVFTADGYFRTGDRGEIDSMGRLRIVGRLKEEFKTAKGEYVIPASIEKLLSLCSLLESVSVFGAGMTSPFVMAVIVPDKRKECEAREHRVALETQLLAELDRVNAQLEHHEQLRFVVVCQEPWTSDNGFLTPTLKVRRSLIEQRFAALFSAWERSPQRVIWLETL